MVQASISGAGLDPVTGRIVGFALAEEGRPGVVEIALDDRVLVRRLAVAQVSDLGAIGVALVGAPPIAGCCFTARLPAGEVGAVLSVTRVDGGKQEALLAHEFNSDAALSRYREGSLMSDSVTLENLRFHGGVLHAILNMAAGGEAPKVLVQIRGETIAEAMLKAAGHPNGWELTASVPPSVLSDGVVVMELVFAADGSTLAQYPIAAGAALSGDLASEVASLRAELDQLKRSFRTAMAAGVLTRDERPMIVAEALAQVDNLLETRERRDRQVGPDSTIPDWDDDGGIWEPDD